MGFRQPFTRARRPDEPGRVGVGEYCHDNAVERGRPRAGGHLRVEPDRQAGQLRLAVLRRRQLAGAHDDPLGLRDQRLDGPEVRLLADDRCRRTSATRRTARRRSSRPTTAWTRCPARSRRRRSGKYPGAPDGQSAADFGDLSAGGMQPITGPIYRYNATPAGQGAVPGLLGRLVADPQPRLRQRLLEGGPPAQGQQQDAAGPGLPARTTAASTPARQLEPGDRHAVRPGRRAVHVALFGQLLPYRHQREPAEPDRQGLVQRPGRVPHGHQRAERVRDRDRSGLPGPPEHLRQLGQAAPGRDGLGLRRRQEHRVPRTGRDRVAAVFGGGHVRGREGLQRRVPRDRPQGQRRRGQDGHVRGPQDQRHDASGHLGRGVRQQGPARLLRRLGHADHHGDRRRGRRLRGAPGRVPLRRRCLDPVHRAGGVQHGRQLHRRVPRHGQGQQHVRGQVDDVPHPRRRGLRAVALGRVRRHDAEPALAASHAQRRHAGERRSRSRAASCTCRRPTSSSTPPRRTRPSAR